MQTILPKDSISFCYWLLLKLKTLIFGILNKSFTINQTLIRCKKIWVFSPLIINILSDKKILEVLLGTIMNKRNKEMWT